MKVKNNFSLMYIMQIDFLSNRYLTIRIIINLRKKTIKLYKLVKKQQQWLIV